MQSCLYTKFGGPSLRRFAISTKCAGRRSSSSQVSSIPSQPYLRYGASPLQIAPKSPKSRRPRGMVVNAGVEPVLRHGNPTPIQQPGERASAVRKSPTAVKVSERKKLKRERLSPPAALARWLDMESDWERELYWLSIKRYLSASSLPNILLEHLHRSKYLATTSGVQQSFHDQAIITLRNRGLTPADVGQWAWIVSAQSTDEMAERFLSVESRKPTFLLLEILRRDVQHVRTLKLLLGYTWHRLAGAPQSSLVKLPAPELDDIFISKRETMLQPATQAGPVSTLEDSTLTLIISRLLRQARRIWAPAVVSISHMVGLIIHSMLQRSRGETKHLEPRMHYRLCKIYNHTLHLLALPASIDPYKSMSHNWRAQRVLLETVGHFDPPLTLDQDSYRAVVHVLAASRKSDRETRVASLRTRSWPPWRVDQDGMDAQRSPEEDLSRVISAAMRATESGYTENVKDQALRILGGQEPDGTPTIHTRSLVKRRSQPSRRDAQCDAGTDLWVARIQATRDVQEAWSAFRGFEDQGGKPSSHMYLAMFEKLESNTARPGRCVDYDPSPGDSKEVFVPSNDNVSTFYQQRLSPPTSDELYDQMLRSGCRPSGRLLTFLLGHAPTVGRGLQYLRDSQVNERAVAFLTGDKEISPVVLKKVPAPTFAAFITLLCRFAPRAVLVPPLERDEEDEHDVDTELVRLESRYEILEPQKHAGGPPQNPLLHCVELLKHSQTSFRPAWYALFDALARRNVIVDRNLVGDPRNDLIAWQVLVAALGDFHRFGLELDPRGFQIICRGLEKAVLASFNVSLPEKKAVFASSPATVVIDEFLKLSESDETGNPYHIPQLLHSIGGQHLHPYVRVLGLTEDHERIMQLLGWMRRRCEVLNEIAAQSRNGQNLLRRVFVAVRVFLSGTDFETEARELVESVDHWNGWPEESEAQEYLDRWSDKSVREQASHGAISGGG